MSALGMGVVDSSANVYYCDDSRSKTIAALLRSL